MTASTAPNYGKGEYTLPSDTIDLAEDQAQLMAWLEGFLKKPNVDIPRPPAVAMEVLALSKKPTARIEDLAALLEREPLLAGRVLRLSNSAMYSGAMPCVTLKQSLIRMGLGIVRDVVMEAAMQMTVLHCDGVNLTLESVRRHSSAVAWVSRFVARNTPLEAENAFLLGLLHDVGISVGLVGLTEYLKAKKQVVKLTPSRWLAVESILTRAGIPQDTSGQPCRKASCNTDCSGSRRRPSLSPTCHVYFPPPTA
jgi:HD-like signal output (HDOD) protein